ncbi:MBL fold metallo-hydrolase [Thermodesulfobacteriota bacterium]
MYVAKKITDNIFQVGGSGLSHPDDCSVYLLELGDLVLVDAGAASDPSAIVDNVTSLGYSEKSISHVILTHCHIDHIGGAAELRRRCGCSLVAHELEASPIETGESRITAADMYGVSLDPFPLDIKIGGDGQTLSFRDGDLECIHTPGHTPGSMSVVYDSGELRVLFGQDVHGPLLPDFGSDREAFLASLRRLKALDADVLCEGHFGVFRTAAEVRKYIDGYISEYC